MEENKVKCAVDALLDKKAFDVKSLKVGPVTTITAKREIPFLPGKGWKDR